jgi:hypothetical protein
MHSENNNHRLARRHRVAAQRQPVGSEQQLAGASPPKLPGKPRSVIPTTTLGWRITTDIWRVTAALPRKQSSAMLTISGGEP